MIPKRLTRVAKPFGIRIHHVRSLSSLYRANVAYRASTDQGDLLIKPFQPRKSRNTAARQMDRMLSCVRLLKDRSYPHMPQWMATRNGRLGVRVSGRPYYVTEWIEGRTMADEPDYVLLGQALAKLHSIGSSAPETSRASTARQFRLLLSGAARFRRLLPRLCRRSGSAGHWYRKYGKKCVRLSREARHLVRGTLIRELGPQENRQPVLVHGDVTLPNILVSPKGLMLIDWDTLQPGSAYFEAVKTLTNTTGFDPGKMGAFLTGYEEVRPLQRSERILIAALFRFPREVWYAADETASGNKGSFFPIVKATWQDRLRAVRWLDAWSHVNSAENG
jgi:Ser/Thr protein kinase RdoA (MazF antagonist)